MSYAAIGTTLSIGSAAFQVYQALEARKDLRAANRAADDLLAAARRKLSVDRFEGLKAPIEAYQMAEDAQVQQQQQSLTALTEAGPRALAAGIGKVDLTGLQATEDRRQKMAQDIFELEKLKTTEAAKRDAALASLDLAGVEGAQEASLALEQQFAAAVTGAAQTVGSAGLNLYKESDLYGRDFAGRKTKEALDSGLITQAQADDYTKFINNVPAATFRQLNQQQIMGGFDDYLKNIAGVNVTLENGNVVSGVLPGVFALPEITLTADMNNLGG